MSRPLSSNIGLSAEWWAGTGLADDPEFHDRVQRNSPFDSNIFCDAGIVNNPRTTSLLHEK